jgi:hypothetical protein
MRNIQKCTKSQEKLPNMHKIPRGVGFYAYLEVLHGILCIFGSSFWDLVHYSKSVMGFCAFLEVLCGILCLFGEELPKRHKIPHRTSKNAQNPMRNLQKCTKSNEEHPKKVPHGILCIFGSSMWDFVPFWKFLMGFCAFLQDPGGILCIFGSSSWDFVHFRKILVGFCAFMEVLCGIVCHEDLPKMHKIP